MNYKQIATDARKKVLELIYKAKTSHIGSNFSCIDILTVLFNKIDLDKDKFILSAGWKAASLYYFLWKKGRITEEELNSYCQPNSKFIGLAEPITKDIIYAGGSMGQGLAAGCALAWSKQQRNQDGKIYVLESDGGMQVGINWEAAWFANQHKLDNLVLLIDCNKFQAMGETKNILNMKDLDQKLKSFGWIVFECDGHNYSEIKKVLNYPDKLSASHPRAIIFNTIKGRGVKKWENDNLWHYAQIKEDDYKYALQELNA